MTMNKDEFDDLFDPDMVQEFRAQFNELHIKQQQERISQNPYEKWFYELSQAFIEQGIKYFREPDSEIMFVQLSRDFQVEQKQEVIVIREIEEYMNIGVPAAAVAAAIRAGLLSPVFKFWRDKNDESDD
jgi:hypothetical protein